MRPSANSTASSPRNSARTRTDADALYIHLPFCKVKCGYCDFNSYARTPDSPVAEFIDALTRELRQLPEGFAPVTIFVGGGTPTMLSCAELEAFLEALHGRVRLGPDAEFTVEANPESVDRDKAMLLHGAGVNRVSVGAQTFDPARLRFLDRPHGPDAVPRALEVLRAVGFDNLSIDLIFGLPGQTMAEWSQDLERALELSTEHLSCYNLTYEPGTALHRDLVRGVVTPNDEFRDREMFLHTRRRLTSAGFEAYEISNFARPGRACRHNVNYWRGGDYFACGPGASAHRRGVRTTNVRPVSTYIERLGRGLPPTDTAETLSPSTRLAEAAWLGVRLSEGFSLDDLSRRYGHDARTRLARPLADHQARGLLALDPDGDRVRLTADGVLFTDLVGGSFLDTAGATQTAKR